VTPKINWKPSTTDLRKFGWTILIGFGVIGLILFFRSHRDTAVTVWAISSAVAFLAILMPPMSKPFYLLWMGIAFLLGSVMSRIVLSVIFFVVLTPVALVFRLMGRDALKKKKDLSATSYWSEHPKTENSDSYKHLF
jgi:hypothetical protein